jgi:hypothetical protein
MALSTTEIQILISCPKDVNTEKNIVKEICELLNKTLIAVSCNVRLMCREFSELYGHIGIRPQQFINDSFIGYNVYLGILFMRFGTPTGGINPLTQKEFESGTEEEFFLAWQNQKNGKEPKLVYFYFKEQIGSKSSRENEQAGKVLSFKETLIEHKNLVHSFTDERDFERNVTQLLTQIAFSHCEEKKLQVKQGIINSFTKSAQYELITSSAINSLRELKYYLHRSLSALKIGEDKQNNLGNSEGATMTLQDVIETNSKIVLLGNAGSGKSVELQQTAKAFLSTDTALIPIYKKFNTYTGQALDDFLPQEWRIVEEQILVIFLDGLDEIPLKHFNDAARNILDFSERHPQIKIIISCRTNFYELPTPVFSGTLTGFEVFTLNDVSLSEIKDLLQSQFKIDGADFIQQAFEHSFLDLVRKPFFLNILINHYIINNRFTSDRCKIIEEFTYSMIDSDKEHFKGTLEVLISHHEIIELLEKISFVMELLGKNFLTDKELYKILSEKSDREQIKRFSAFNRNAKTEQWMFEHNNIQEFFAAKVLSRQSLAKLIEVVSFPPIFKKVKPTWVNTISFLISIGNQQLVQELIVWLVKVDCEIIVKFESDRVPKDLRLKLFQQIFNFYKEKDIWLSSNKFSDNELCRFGYSSQSIDFLVNEVNDVQNSRIVRLNAIHLLESFDLIDFDPKYKVMIKVSFLAVVAEKDVDPAMVHSILYALARLKITDHETVNAIVALFRSRNNQYIRTGMYRLLNASDCYEEYVQIYIDGLDIEQNVVSDRDAVNLADESWQLEEGIKKIKSSTALRKILELFEDRKETRRIDLYHKNDIFKIILQNTFLSYNSDPTIFESIEKLYRTLGRFYDQQATNLFIPFFEQYGKKWEVFNNIWKDSFIKDFDKDYLLETLLDDDIVMRLLEQYRQRYLTNENMQRFYSLLLWKFGAIQEKNTLIDTFEDAVRKLGELNLERPKTIDWKAINIEKNQKGFNVVFDKALFLEEVGKVFLGLDQSELNEQDLWELRKSDFRDIDDCFTAPALEILRDFTRNNSNVTLEKVINWVNEDSRFESFQIDQIFRYLSGQYKDHIILSEIQEQFITEWCRKTSATMNITKSVYNREDDSSSVSVSWKAEYLWFFINLFRIVLPEAILLDLTMYYDFNNRTQTGSAHTIETIEKFLAKDKIRQRVNENLSVPIPVVHVWVSNALYAIENEMKVSYSYILRDLRETGKAEYHRRIVLEAYYRKTNDEESLEELLQNIGSDEIRWTIIKLLIEVPAQAESLSNYFKQILSEKLETKESKFVAANYLMQLNDLDGLYYITNQIVANQDATMDFHWKLHSLSKLSSAEAIPSLIVLLKISKQPAFQIDKFNRLESLVFDSFHHIGLQSEGNFQLVRLALQKFIEENASQFSNLNFIYFNIQRIEEQLYIKKSQQYGIGEAIDVFQKL